MRPTTAHPCGDSPSDMIDSPLNARQFVCPGDLITTETGFLWVLISEPMFNDLDAFRFNFYGLSVLCQGIIFEDDGLIAFFLPMH